MSATIPHEPAEAGPAVPDAVAVHAPGAERRLSHPRAVALIAFALAAFAFATNHPVANGLVAAGLAAVLVVLAATDIEHRIIPNRIVLPAAGAALLARLVVSHGSVEYLVAALAAGAFFVLPSLFGRQWMGMGDVKLVVLLGAGLGQGVLDAVTIAFLSMFPFALGTLVRGGLGARRTTLPFGPFLAFGALVVLIFPGLVGLGGS
jgi:prepilin signal peptidase PulO-like enzyme (type II secretory pathway)